MQCLAFSTLALLTVACDAQKQHTAATKSVELSAPVPPSKLQRLFTRDLLAEQLPYFESLAGPAMKIEHGVRVYNVDGCRLNVTTKDETVESVQLQLSPMCDVDLSDVVSDMTIPQPLYKLTIGGFQNASVSSMHGAGCIEDCALEQEDIYAWSHGRNPMSQIDVVVRALPESEINRLAISAWRDELLAKYGEKWVLNRDYNCDAGERDHSSRQLAPIRVNAIQIGRHLATPDKQCNFASAPNLISHTDTAANDWYFVALHPPACKQMNHLFPGARSVESFISGAERHGFEFDAKWLGKNLVALTKHDDPTSTPLVLARGLMHCQELTRRAAEAER